MVKKTKKPNDGVKLVINEDVAKALGIDQKTDLEMIVVDDALIVKPKHKKSSAQKNRENKLKDEARRIMDKYEPVLKKLAKT